MDEKKLKLQKILVRARRQVFSEMVGNNPSVFQGEGYDFIELREYMPGDDIRHIDWNITAKMQTPYIKIFREERELNVVLVSMLSGSVYFGSKEFKQDVIAEVVAQLGYSVLKNGDVLSHYIFADKMYTYTKPSKKLHSVQNYLQQIVEFNPLGKSADYKLMADTLFKRIRRKSLIVIVADFFDIPQLRLLAKKHEVVAVIVRDRYEEKPPQMGFSSLIDPENNQKIEGEFNSRSIKEYEAKVKEHDKQLYEVLRKDQVRFTKLYTDELVGVKLRRLFEGRR